MIDLSDVPVVDNHVHPWRESSKHLSAEALAESVSFVDAVVTSVREPFLPAEQLEAPLRLYRETSLSVRALLVDLARFLGCEERWEAVAAARNRAAEADYRGWAQRLFEDARIDALLVDEGGSRPRVPLEQLGQIAPARLRRVARTDNFVRDLLEQEESWPRFFQRYQEELDAAIADGAIAFKSVIAYRTGLNVEPISEDEARRNFEVSRGGPISAQKPLRDFLLCHAMDVARERGLWVHIHAATGDPDIVFQRANPGQLYPLLHSERFRANRVVLIHGGWPWVSEAAVMVAMLPNLYLDVSEGAIFGLANLRQRILEVLESAPYTKILYAADASLPEALWLVAKRYKRALGQVLGELAADGFFSPREAYAAGRAILHDNAARMYGL